MKLDLSFEQNQQNINVPFVESGGKFNADFGETFVIHDGQNGATFTPNVSEDGILSWTNDRELPNPEPVNIKGKDGKDGIDGKDGKNGVDGKNGIDGKDGYTPIKGEDYFTAEEVQEIAEQAAELVDIPEGGVTSWNDLTDKPDFAPIATSGSWNDLTDKPFGEEKSWVELWEEKQYIILENNRNGIVLNTPPTSLSGNCRYTFNGIEYETEIVTRQPSTSYYPSDIGGNPHIFNSEFEDNGQPIAIVYMPRYKQYSVRATADMIGVPFSFSAKKLNIISKQIDEKYLPESVVIESELTAKGYQTEDQVKSLINEALGVIENGTY